MPQQVKKLPVTELDPSMALGFLFESMAEFEEFERHHAEYGLDDLFCIAEKAPRGPTEAVLDL